MVCTCFCKGDKTDGLSCLDEKEPERAVKGRSKSGVFRWLIKASVSDESFLTHAFYVFCLRIRSLFFGEQETLVHVQSDVLERNEMFHNESVFVLYDISVCRSAIPGSHIFLIHMITEDIKYVVNGKYSSGVG